MAEITIDREPATIWANTTVTEPSDAPLRVKLFAPAGDGTRFLWQVCRFPSADAGPYRCGLDRETAQAHPGRWVVRAFLDEDRIGRRAFWIE